MRQPVDPIDRRLSLTRREFTLEAALSLLAGCVVTISSTACGGGTPTTPTPAATTDVTGVVAANHGHTAAITGAQITAGGAIAVNIQGSAPHPHTLSISQAELTSLRNRQAITSVSSTDASHSHSVTFTPA